MTNRDYFLKKLAERGPNSRTPVAAIEIKSLK